MENISKHSKISDLEFLEYIVSHNKKNKFKKIFDNSFKTFGYYNSIKNIHFEHKKRKNEFYSNYFITNGYVQILKEGKTNKEYSKLEEIHYNRLNNLEEQVSFANKKVYNKFTDNDKNILKNIIIQDYFDKKNEKFLYQNGLVNFYRDDNLFMSSYNKDNNIDVFKLSLNNTNTSLNNHFSLNLNNKNKKIYGLNHLKFNNKDLLFSKFYNSIGIFEYESDKLVKIDDYDNSRKIWNLLNSDYSLYILNDKDENSEIKLVDLESMKNNNYNLKYHFFKMNLNENNDNQLLLVNPWFNYIFDLREGKENKLLNYQNINSKSYELFYNSFFLDNNLFGVLTTNRISFFDFRYIKDGILSLNHYQDNPLDQYIVSKTLNDYKYQDNDGFDDVIDMVDNLKNDNFTNINDKQLLFYSHKKNTSLLHLPMVDYDENNFELIDLNENEKNNENLIQTFIIREINRLNKNNNKYNNILKNKNKLSIGFHPSYVNSSDKIKGVKLIQHKDMFYTITNDFNDNYFLEIYTIKKGDFINIKLKSNQNKYEFENFNKYFFKYEKDNFDCIKDYYKYATFNKELYTESYNKLFEVFENSDFIKEDLKENPLNYYENPDTHELNLQSNNIKDLINNDNEIDGMIKTDYIDKLKDLWDTL